MAASFFRAARRGFASASRVAYGSLATVGGLSIAITTGHGKNPVWCSLPNEEKASHTHFSGPGVVLDPKTVENLAAVRKLPVMPAPMSIAPAVPPPITRKTPARLICDLTSRDILAPVSETQKYPFWTFNDVVPGPFIRAREGDTLEVHHTNKDSAGVAHNIDFHAVTGPGGGAACTLSEADETTVGIFQLMKPGLYIYHCAAAPVPQHVQNGMYGLILVEPKEGLPPVDREFYVVQSEFYGSTNPEDPKEVEPSYSDGLIEHPMYVVFNGKKGSLTEKPLSVNQGESVRIFFGNGGPNLVSSFHVIGMIFDKVYREGDLVSPPARNLQTTLVPAGGSCVVEFDAVVPGNYTLVDHSIFRTDKGAIGFLKVAGKPRPDIYDAKHVPTPCPGCKMHN